MPTLGEFITRARAYGYTKQVHPPARAPGANRLPPAWREGNAAKLVDLPAIRESDRLTRAALESLCERAEIPREDFGL